MRKSQNHEDHPIEQGIVVSAGATEALLEPPTVVAAEAPSPQTEAAEIASPGASEFPDPSNDQAPVHEHSPATPQVPETEDSGAETTTPPTFVDPQHTQGNTPPPTDQLPAYSAETPEAPPTDEPTSGLTRFLLASAAALCFILFLCATAFYVKRRNAGNTKAPVAEKKPDIRDAAQDIIHGLFSANSQEERLAKMEFYEGQKDEIETFFATNPQLEDLLYLRHTTSSQGVTQAFYSVAITGSESSGVVLVRTNNEGLSTLHWPSFKQNLTPEFRDFLLNPVPKKMMTAQVFLRRVHGLGKSDHLLGITEFPGSGQEFRVDGSYGSPEDLQSIEQTPWEQTIQVTLHLQWMKKEDGTKQLICGNIIPNW